MLEHSKSAPGTIRSSKPVVDRYTTLEKGVITLIHKNYLDTKNWYVISNIKKYKPSMDVSIWGQKIGELPELCEVYWRGEYVAEISLMDSPSEAEIKINDGLIEAVQKKKGVIV